MPLASRLTMRSSSNCSSKPDLASRAHGGSSGRATGQLTVLTMLVAQCWESVSPLSPSARMQIDMGSLERWTLPVVTATSGGVTRVPDR